MKRVMQVFLGVWYVAMGAAFMWVNIQYPAPFTPLFWVFFTVIVWTLCPLLVTYIIRMRRARQ